MENTHIYKAVTPETAGKLVRATRHRLGLSQQKLSGLCGMRRQQIHEVEVGTSSNPTVGTLTRIFAGMGFVLVLAWCPDYTPTEDIEEDKQMEALEDDLLDTIEGGDDSEELL